MTRVNWQSFSNLADRIQVTSGDLCYLFDLSYKTPTVVSEVASTQLLLDPNNYVEAGFKLVHQTDTGSKRSVEQTQVGGIVLEKINDQVCGVFRSYCDIDIFETRELLRMR